MYTRPHFYSGHLVFHSQKYKIFTFEIGNHQKNGQKKAKSIPVCMYKNLRKST